MMMINRFLKILPLLLVIGGCGAFGIQPDPPPPTAVPQATSSGAGEGGLIDKWFGDKSSGEGGGGGIAVNSFLWRASLDTMSFMPLKHSDPFGGVINYDWYSPPESPGERLKVTIYILDRQLRADGLRISVFRQTRSGEAWLSAKIDPKTTRDLENAILKRAREMRIASSVIK
ncbi:MAG: DUF3576 domain-containing protein [Rhodospirillaceae bacterium]|jgi:hypothetical protein|nr:DUF3576 domain-containing protein [Rhodospirillaceae bacterium]MBT5812497.1 DUF3576 domain-containing protein [Rhodospirillaceae bacterium]